MHSDRYSAKQSSARRAASGRVPLDSRHSRSITDGRHAMTTQMEANPVSHPKKHKRELNNDKIE